MHVLVLALLIGVVTGLRSMTAPAAVSWAAHLGWLELRGTPLALLGASATPYVFTGLAIGELIVDKLPATPSRRTVGPCTARVVIGAFCGAALGLGAGALAGGLVAGALGALGAAIGTLGGYEFRMRLVAATGGRDLPIALLEDAIAVAGAAWIASSIA